MSAQAESRLNPEPSATLSNTWKDLRMSVVCFDPVTGASGDMILGALFDLGADPRRVEGVLRDGGLGKFRLEFERKEVAHHMRYGFCTVHAEEDNRHRHLPDILELIDRGSASARAKSRASAVFNRLAKAEATVHGVAVDDVHFHEVGAIDTVVDVLGTCIALDDLDAAHVYCSAFKVGTGTVTCSHGVLPLPAPATAALLEGFPVQRLDIAAELTTPTGAAILTTLSKGSWSGLTFGLLKTGTGHGRRTHGQSPNILRAYLMEAQPDLEPVEILESDIDDETPEILGALTDTLRAAGALDATLSPLTMKKGRQGARLSVVARVGDGSRLAEIVFRESSTLGIRLLRAQRFVLPRCATTAQTPWGPVQAKRIERPHGIEIAPEADSCRTLARDSGAAMRDIVQAARNFCPTSNMPHTD